MFYILWRKTINDVLKITATKAIREKTRSVKVGRWEVNNCEEVKNEWYDLHMKNKKFNHSITNHNRILIEGLIYKY